MLQGPFLPHWGLESEVFKLNQFSILRLKESFCDKHKRPHMLGNAEEDEEPTRIWNWFNEKKASFGISKRCDEAPSHWQL